MTEKKPDLTKSVVGNMLKEEMDKLRQEQAKRDAEQDAKLARPSVALRAAAAVDITAKYPLAAWAIGVAFIAGGIIWFDGAKMWTLVGVGICFVPGLARKAIDLVTGLKKAKEG